jgi:AbrB family looped-hinge helix DNA binding protein
VAYKEAVDLHETVRVSSKGQIVIPSKLREKASIKQGDLLMINLIGDKMVVEPLNKTKKGSWQQILQETAGSWSGVNPQYIDELRSAALKRLDETL